MLMKAQIKSVGVHKCVCVHQVHVQTQKISGAFPLVFLLPLVCSSDRKGSEMAFHYHTNSPARLCMDSALILTQI